MSISSPPIHSQAPGQSAAADLAAIVDAYNAVTEKLKRSHERLTAEVRRLSDQLDEKNRELARRERLAALGEMAAGVAHEIRNPLAGIQLFTSLLEQDLASAPGAIGPRASSPRVPPASSRHERRLPSGPPHSVATTAHSRLEAGATVRLEAGGTTSLDLVRKISAAVRSLDAVVADILIFAGEARLQLVPVDAWAVIDEVAALTAPLAAEHGSTLYVDDPSTVVPNASAARALLRTAAPRVLADPGSLQRALLNLTRNAVEAAGRGGRIWLSAELVNSDDARGTAAAARIRIRVADDGPGVPDELASAIFNPFFSTRSQGTGLGLSIVHRIAESHGGTVSVSRRPGGGAVFSLTLPAVE